MHHETLLARYLAEHLTHFHQTYVNDTLWDRDERDQKVKGHGGIKYAGNSTFWVCYHNVLKIISQIFTKLTPMMYYGTEMNVLNFGLKRSQFKFTVE